MQVDNAAVAEGVGLRGGRDREELFDIAHAAVAHRPQRAACKGMFEHRAGLPLRHRLARVEQHRVGRSLPGIGEELRAIESQRILRMRRIQRVDGEHRLARAHGHAQFPVQPGALRGGMRARAIGGEMLRARQPTDAIVAAARLQRHAPGGRLAERGGRRDVARAIGIVGEHLHHAPRRVAVQHRERPAQHFDAPREGQWHLRHLALPVRHRRRHAIQVQPHAADPEAGPRAEPPDRDLFVLRRIAAIAREDTGEGRQAFGERGAQAVVAPVAALDDAYRRGDVARPLRRARARDLDAIQRDGRGHVRGLRERQPRAGRHDHTDP